MTESESAGLTEDGRHVVISGLRRRATDPAIPDALRAELVSERAAARRNVLQDALLAECHVQEAEVALGERGEPWWASTPAGRRVRLAATMGVLLRHRRPDATICPSDAARVVGGSSWRDLMDDARSVAAELAARGLVVVRQNGVDVDVRTAEGPVRIARGPNWSR